ncbi:MAG: Unknown protein [uncultured Thiotrichaceae bacterium]|uniref:Uncharacterized protein n=1 Tax=uncultured Thiotrichaceae bacterium TaxID=298394 RepID=A0A6S6UAH1_9GAMM|nr:MAG: Unknown protein [uncultured Thiotrichaceae bacterium]
MHTEDTKTPQSAEPEDTLILEFDEIDEIDPLAEMDEVDIKITKPKPRMMRKNIEDILEERALNRQLTDVFDDELLD